MLLSATFWAEPSASAAFAAPSGSALAASPDPVPYALTSALKTGVKSVLNERVPEGARIGAVVRLYNQSARVSVVPAFELRAVTSEGIPYTLRPSRSNPVSVQPKETVELSFLIAVKRQDSFVLSKLAWVSVDEYVYPKKETTVASMGVAGLEWNGPHSAASGGAGRPEVAWGTAFALPGGDASIAYSPAQLSTRDAPDGMVAVLALLAENRGARPAWIPDLSVVGKAGTRYVAGDRLGGDEATPLAPGERRYVRFALPAASGVAWEKFALLTPETFAEADGAVVRYAVGRVHIGAPPSSGAGPTAQAYKLESAIRFQAPLPALPEDVELALVDLQRFETDGDGVQTGVAKFVVTNRGKRALPFPQFGVEWTLDRGVVYAGTRQDVVWKTLLPNIGYVVSYAFALPASEQGAQASIGILEPPDDAAGPALPIALLRTKLSAADDASGRMYPFAFEAKSSSLDGRETEAGYAYRLTLDASLSREKDAIVDRSSTGLLFELADATGHVYGTKRLGFAGADRLRDGVQVVAFDGSPEEARGDMVVRMYEVFRTPDGGEAKRLVHTFE
jgi:hypothetical protein